MVYEVTVKILVEATDRQDIFRRFASKLEKAIAVDAVLVQGVSEALNEEQWDRNSVYNLKVV